MSSKVFEEYMQTTNDFINGVIEKKYLLNDEKTYDDIINIRFKNKLSKISSSPSKVAYLINSFLDKRLIPAGSIISGLGNENFKCSLSNCYHIPIEEDSIEGIYECQKKLARTFSHRGGSGTSITILRPKNAPVNNSAKTSTGAVSFMPGFSLLAHDIGQSGRRAALIITIDCRHPDVLDFIWSKAKPDLVFEKDSLTNFQPDISYANISVFLTNNFMEAVKNDADWDLFFPDTTFENYNKEWDGDYDKWLQKGYPTIHYKTVNARDMLNQISEACWLTGDPGVGFIDNVKNFSTGLFDSKLTPINYNPCLPNWAPVLTPEGYKSLNVLNNQIIIDKQTYTCSDVFQTKKLADVYEVELQNGIRFWSTIDHEIGKFNFRNNSIQLTELKDLIPGKDYVKCDYSPIQYKYNEEEYLKGYFCGFIFGDGSFSFDNTKQIYILSICLGESQIYLEDEIKNIFYKIFQENCNDFYTIGKTRQTKSSKKSITTRFKEIFGANSKDNFILLEKNINYQLGFITGLITTDGYVNYSQKQKMINVNQSSIRGHRILSEIQLSLASVGVYSNLGITNHAKKGKRNNKVAYRLEITDVETFNKHITLDPIKNDIVIQILNNYGSVKHTRINTLKQRQKIKSIIKLDGQYPVYDITVPGPHKFVSSCIIISNCGEQTLPNFGNCLLGCSALHKYVTNPYTINAEFDINTFLTDIEHLVYFLDLMIDINTHPLKEQNELDQYSRRIGVEVTGLNDMWAMLNMDYGSEKSCEFIDDIMFAKAVCEIKTSIQLAKEKGHAPCFKTKSSRKKFIEQPYIQRILNKLLKTNRKEIENDILNHGLRNSAFNTMGPTGTISIIADNCTSGGEPIYEISYKRESRLFPDKKINMVHLPLVKHVGESILEMEKDEIKKKYHYTAAHDINYHTRIKVQSTLQKWTDNSISSTINLKNDTKIKDIFDIYVEAYENNLKGVTIFRDGCKKGILSSDNESNLNELSKPKEIVTTQMVKQHIELVKPEYEKTLRGYRNLKYWQKNKIYLMVNVDNEGKPKEIFAKIPNKLGQINDMFNQQVLNEKKSYWESTCRLVSLLLRINTPIELIINQLQKSSPTINEVPNIISQVLKKYISYDKETIEKITKEKSGGEYCSVCEHESIIYQGGCSTCLNCGDSKCG
jgi:ribonucleotide reductase alpha subunit